MATANKTRTSRHPRNRAENHFRREVLDHLTDRPSNLTFAPKTRPRPTTVFGYLRAECRNDVDGRHALRDVFALRWPLLYRELLFAENVIGMTIAEADAAEAEIVRELWECA